MYSALFPDLQKMALCCSHGLVTFDLKIRCEVWRLWRAWQLDRSTTIYDVWMCGCVFLYK